MKDKVINMTKRIENISKIITPYFDTDSLDYSIKIGGTEYAVSSHFNTEGNQTILQQFKQLILAQNLI